MGESSSQANVLAVLAALEQALRKQGKALEPGTACAAALKAYAAA
jgi:alanine-glyoxylate transaminase/serine-glyoxylate transaminase/serine-pyruvate transaminase